MFFFPHAFLAPQPLQPPSQVFLSATLSNSSQFAAWVAHLHKSPCHVVYTDYRPTPLQVRDGGGCKYQPKLTKPSENEGVWVYA